MIDRAIAGLLWITGGNLKALLGKSRQCK